MIERENDIEVEVFDSLQVKRLAYLLKEAIGKNKVLSFKLMQAQQTINELSEGNMLQNELIDLKYKNTILEGEYAKLKEQYKKLNDKYSNTINGIYSLDGHYGTLQNKIKELQEENKKLKKAHNDCIARILELNK